MAIYSTIIANRTATAIKPHLRILSINFKIFRKIVNIGIIFYNVKLIQIFFIANVLKLFLPSKSLKNILHFSFSLFFGIFFKAIDNFYNIYIFITRRKEAIIISLFKQIE